MEKIKIAMLVNDMNINGISMVIMNYCKNLDKSKFDISVISGTPINDFYKSQCREFNIKLYELPARKQKKLKYFQALYRVLKQKFDIVHVHGNSATISIELLIAKICGVKVRIAHSHNTTCDHIKIHKLLWPLFRQVYTHGLACGQQAGKWMFHNGKFYVLPNAFETANFIYDNEARQRIRNELKLDNKYVIGHIGRFNNQKNHPFLLRIFTEIAKKREDAYLLLVGNGPDFEEIQKLISEHPFKDRIIVYGECKDTGKLYSAFDVFALPSRHEGLVCVLLEAQINGLYSVASTAVPDEVKITENVEFIDLKEKPEKWAEHILNSHDIDRDNMYNQYFESIQKYDIHQSVKNLEFLYIKFLNEQRKI